MTETERDANQIPDGDPEKAVDLTESGDAASPGATPADLDQSDSAAEDLTDLVE